MFFLPIKPILDIIYEYTVGKITSRDVFHLVFELVLQNVLDRAGGKWAETVKQDNGNFVNGRVTSNGNTPHNDLSKLISA